MGWRAQPVRLATPADEDALYQILLALDRDNGFGVPISEQKVRAQIRIGTERRGGIIGVIDGPDGTLAATVGLFLQTYWQSEETFLQELWLYIDPPYRGWVDHMLFEYAKAWRERLSEHCGYDMTLITSVSSPRRLAAKERLWRRRLGLGARRIGAIFTVNGR